MACKFFTLLHKIARFWGFLANFYLKMNRRSATIIRYLRVVQTWRAFKTPVTYYQQNPQHHPHASRDLLLILSYSHYNGRKTPGRSSFISFFLFAFDRQAAMSIGL